jgi:hypothetical protein
MFLDSKLSVKINYHPRSIAAFDAKNVSFGGQIAVVMAGHNIFAAVGVGAHQCFGLFRS